MAAGWARHLFAAMAVPIVMSFAAANGQSPILDDVSLRRTLPGPGDDKYYGPYYRWRSNSPISVMIVTDGQALQCTTKAIDEVRRHIALIRAEVPSLSRIFDPSVSENVPSGLDGLVVVIGLPTANRRVDSALARLAKQRRDRDQLLVIDSSWTSAHGSRHPRDGKEQETVYSFGIETVLGIQKDHVQFAYHSQTNKRGIEIFDYEICDQTPWALALYDALGTYNLSVLANSLISPYFQRDLFRLYPAADGFYRRLFMQALYALPPKPDVGQLREAYLRPLDEHCTFRSRSNRTSELEVMPSRPPVSLSSGGASLRSWTVHVGVD